MSLCLITHYACDYLYVCGLEQLDLAFELKDEESFNRIATAQIGITIATAYISNAFDAFYLMAGWSRSYSILKRVIPKYLSTCDIALKAVLAIFSTVIPFIQTVWPILLTDDDQALKATRLGNQLFLGCLSFLIAFDVGFLLSFVRFLSHTVIAESETPEFKFLLISRFGVVSSALYILLLVFYGVVACGVVLPHLVDTVLYFIVYNIMCALKVALFWASLKEKENGQKKRRQTLQYEENT
ncbi:hypothetical protein BDR26DRAFT_709585 [Obelidium mucronatum]|nr:hypothetical protein BDR26DRAFT_709585 [Obelidium mucronatum]